jgi:hypothetical protein
MRSHMALLFVDVPPSLCRAPGSSLPSSYGATVLSFDFTSLPFCGFSRPDDPANWYAQFEGLAVEAYPIRARDQETLARRALAAATRWAQTPPAYNDSFKWNAGCVPCWPYPGMSLDGRPRQERGTNCVGITLDILQEALGRPLGLQWEFENHLPGLLPEQLRELGVVGDPVAVPFPSRSGTPLLRMHR